MNLLHGWKEVHHYVKSVRPRIAWNIQQEIIGCVPHAVNIATGVSTVALTLRNLKGNWVSDNLI